MNAGFFRGLTVLILLTRGAAGGELIVDDSNGALGTAQAPVMATIKLSRSDRRAAEQGRLRLLEFNSPSSAIRAIPAQLFATGDSGDETQISWLMPPGQKGRRSFLLKRVADSLGSPITAKQDSASGQFDITDAGKPVLRYNYATIEPGEIISQVATNARIYARARSDYIHPLFGFDGESLTQDWSLDHPHHRGIYWAWPEVDWLGNRGDLHALQHVIARPTGKCTVTSGPVFAQIESENVWKWEDTNAIVLERTVIRAYRATGQDRIIDLEFSFAALNEPVLLARRGTDKYGGLNMRFAKVEDQEIVPYTSPADAAPRIAWAELSGRFGGNANPSGIVVLQHHSNPDYPGEWVQYPNLNWLQPTFPASGTRYELKKGRPLVLRYRLWVHRGAKTSEADCAARWRAFHAPAAPKYFPVSPIPKRPI